MEKKIRSICISSYPGAIYFLQIAWKKDLGDGFTVALTDGHSAWTGEVSQEDVSQEAKDMEMERSNYVEELRKALIMTALPANKYNFDLLEDRENPEIYHFTYEKTLKEVAFKLGSTKLKSVQNPAHVIKELISYCLGCTAELYSRNEHLQKENERLQCDWNDMHAQLEKFVDGKEELEQTLYTQFTCVLNEKKAKIRNLKEKLSEAQERLKQKSEDSAPVDTLAASEMKYDAFGGSTDEEQESPAVASKTAAKSQRRSLVIDDAPDVAPSRKRRQRGQKTFYTDVVANTTKTSNEETQRCNPAPAQSVGKTFSTEGTSSQTLKNTPDPDDLFSDI
ncbi:X-ray repair complementing defective repair in Chinese hamster cells 4 L homeolog isoform X2 [Xenopus laevis]|nr:X-ray repair complementing defective repair in Chinese hamster cells 4 L homeolog isoform X2 [Xenopus laevis]OCU02342.1 hypothetical protein XELAEV_18008105mg [Xenopus laevis]